MVGLGAGLFRPRGARPLAFEGVFQSLAQGLAESYLSAYALWLGAGGLTLGLVTSLPTAATAVVQTVARRLRAAAGGTRRFIGLAWSLQALAYALLSVCVWVAPEVAAVSLLGLIFVAWGLGGVAVPAWTNLVAGVVPRRQRGWFFGLRGGAQQAGVLVAIVGGGLLLHTLGLRGQAARGFMVLFGLAGAMRLLGTVALVAVPAESPPPEVSRAARVEAPRSSARFRRVAFYLWGLHFGTNVATPFFVPYMLHDLGMSYAKIGALLAVPAAVKIATLRYWGRLADRVGPGPLLRTTGWLVAPVSALWLISGSGWWILVVQVYAGIVWGAFELAQASSLIEVTRGRESSVALFHLVDGAMLIGGSLVGGIIVVLSGPFGLSGYLAAMACSSALRVLPAVVLLWRVRDIGRPRWSHLRMPLRVWAIRPSRGMSLRPWLDLPPAAEEEEEEDGDRR